ncbi:type I secretion system permease/ATPase [Celeribacter halophilus]|uniref:Type I secretion system permease/ATPase n=1 Tax=Celeribacter halophilus TaxID=576117 RepID=A0AAW7XXV3_9RHOB|nr:type I secretion system permease/ATPase [Celeribacter halophilus]MDO6457777.1 type I secretion system permease/ATPase [Celeribacter halophilus]MDO6724035.1 type I secretion system permease/ATPase [Celeribacter halophilus]
MTQEEIRLGQEELATVRRGSRGLFWACGVFSICINLLMLTGPLFMLQVYDRVLGSGSEATLVALFSIVAFLYLMMGLLDGTRARILSRIAARFQTRLENRVFHASMAQAARNPRDIRKIRGMDDLTAIRRFLGSPALSALYDLPFAPVFLCGIALFHPYLGLLAVGGGGMLVAVALLHRAAAKPKQDALIRAENEAQQTASRMTSAAEALAALGMKEAAFRRWLKARETALRQGVVSEDTTHGFTAASRALRLFLQSAMLALGAWLVLERQLSAGAMVASSILLGRALQPVDMLIGQWGLVQHGLRGWRDLAELLGRTPAETPRTALPRPKAALSVQQLTVTPPGQVQAALRMVGFDLAPGEALGVIGPSGAGKSTLARALTGVWPPAGGTIRLDGAKLSHYDSEVLGRYIGYLPQQVQLFDGTIAENIAKLAFAPQAEAVIAAAKKADAHDLILSLPEGYDTPVSAAGGLLSGGQLQRIGLARAFYGDPVIVILDEPNANLDNAGSLALNAAIRRHKDEGGAVLIMAHRPSAIQECEKLLVLEGGLRRAFGPRDQVLGEMVRNSKDILRSGTAQGGIR